MYIVVIYTRAYTNITRKYTRFIVVNTREIITSCTNKNVESSAMCICVRGTPYDVYNEDVYIYIIYLGNVRFFLNIKRLSAFHGE